MAFAPRQQMTRAPARCKPAASSAFSCSCLCRRPGGRSVFAHVCAAGSRIAANGPFKGPVNAVSWHHHVAAQLDLVAMDRALHLTVVNLALVIAGHGIAVLFQD